MRIWHTSNERLNFSTQLLGVRDEGHPFITTHKTQLRGKVVVFLQRVSPCDRKKTTWILTNGNRRTALLRA